MALNNVKSGRVTIEVKVLNPDRILNILWNKHIEIYKVKKKNISTIRLEIEYLDYDEVCEVVRNFGGKITIIRREGFIFKLKELKKQLSLAIGLIVFLVVLFCLSNYIWAIDIDVKQNISPFEIRQQLKDIGVQPGIAKKDVVVEEIEKKLENINSEILWLRVRVEGSTLKVTIEEKINPPAAEEAENSNEVVAKMDGEIERVYTYSGNAAVKPGDIVKKGDTLILGIQGREGFEREVKPKGTVIANTFYEKDMEVQISGDKLTRSGNKTSEIYLNIFGKKIYLKKVIDGYKYYDKIEENNGFFNKTIYFEKKAEKVNVDKDEAVAEASKKLEQSLSKTLSNDTKIVDKKITIDEIDENNIMVRVLFTVQQDIAKGVS